MKYFLPTDDEGYEHAAEQNMITKGDEQLTKSDHTRAVKHVTLLNCDQPAPSRSTADPDKNSAVCDFLPVLYLLSIGLMSDTKVHSIITVQLQILIAS